VLAVHEEIGSLVEGHLLRADEQVASGQAICRTTLPNA